MDSTRHAENSQRKDIQAQLRRPPARDRRVLIGRDLRRLDHGIGSRIGLLLDELTLLDELGVPGPRFPAASGPS